MVQEGFEEEAVLPLARMVYGEVGHSYVALARPEGATLVGKFTNVLKFTVKEIDPTSGLYTITYQPLALRCSACPVNMLCSRLQITDNTCASEEANSARTSSLYW